MTKLLLQIQSARMGLMLLSLIGYSLSGIAQIDFQEQREITGPFPDEGYIKNIDIDADGDLDFLAMGQTIVTPTAFSTFLYKNDGNGNFTYVENTPFEGSMLGEAAFGDVDSDNDLDIIIVGYMSTEGLGMGTGKLYINDGEGNFSISSSDPFPALMGSTVKFFNYNDDPHLDVFISGRSSDGRLTSVYVGDGQGNFQEVLDLGLDPFDRPSVVIGDLDGDGDEDIIAGGIKDKSSESGTYIYYRNGDKYIKVPQRLTTSYGGASELVDFDKDGDLDYLICSVDYTLKVEYWINDGTGNFTKAAHPFIKISNYPNLIVQDFDFDDDLDIYLGSSKSELAGNYIYLNDGNGNFTINDFDFPVGKRMGSGAGDFDGKGLVDIILFKKETSNDVSRGVIYINNIELNEPPTVTGIEISGRFLVGFDLSGNYIFMDKEGDEDQSFFQWYRSDDVLGSNKIRIENANEKNYISSDLDEAKFLSLEITPFDGMAEGTIVKSPWIGPLVVPQPELSLSGNSAPILDGTIETSLENHTDFGEIVYGGQISRTYSLNNEGDADLVISEILISGTDSNDFSIQDFMPKNLSVGSQALVTLNFEPSGLGIRTAEIRIHTNQQGSPFSFTVSGTGLNLPPVFNSISSVDYLENGTLSVVDVNASNGEEGLDDENILYTISGGEDFGLFTINTSGQVSFIETPDFEKPLDSNKDNLYLLEITADDGATINNLNVQEIAILVTNLDELPIAVCKDNIILYLDENGETRLSAGDLNDGSSDDLAIVGLSVEPSIFYCDDLGGNTVTLTVLDSGGNSSICQTTITVADKIKPVISPVSPIVTENDQGECGARLIIIAPAVIENCGVLTASGKRSDNLSMDSAFPIGNTTITWSAPDAEEVTQLISVLDAEAPVVGAVETIKAFNDPGSNGSYLIIPTPVYSDCGVVRILGSRSDGLSMENLFPVGETVITWTAKDDTNSAIPVNQKIVVIDNEPPTIESPSPSTFTSEAGNCGVLVSIIPPKVIDNCEGILQSIGVREDEKELDDVFPVGITKIIWSAVDIHDNPAVKVTQIITVEERVSGEIIFTGPDGPKEIGNGVLISASYTDENIVSATWTALDGNLNVHESFSETLNKGIGKTEYTFESLSPGVYTIHLNLKHECGSVVSAIFEYVVIYDPNGGFVTGGGWINSPEGAMKDPAMQMTTGIANFGFNAQYKNGKNDVDEVGGETNFQFKAGDLHFKSSSHQAMSLVVSGGFKATYKGSGALNGEPGYDFMITVIDAAESESHQIDLFRIKISKGSRVIYDNNVLFSAENADPATAIGGGSIVIHKPKDPNKKSQVSALPERTVLEDGLEIFSAYPNPMEGKAVIEFSLSTTTSAVLSLYDLNGREVLSLYSGKVEKGVVYKVEINNMNLMQGIYIYRLTTESGGIYQKQLLVK